LSKSDNTQALHPGWLNKKDMAASLRISVQAFDKWGVEPVARIGRSVYFDARSVVEHKAREIEAKHQPTATEGEEERDPHIEYKIEVERRRLLAAQSEGQEQKNAEKGKRLVDVAFATFALSRMAAEIATVLDTLPLTMKRKHPDLETRHLDTLMRELSKARNQAAGLDNRLPGFLDEFINANT
jgi:terminase small subunit / prophage DNA-packing protein